MIQYSMFKNTKAFSSFSVDDISKAKDFYAKVLGINVSEEYGGLTLNLQGSSVMIYPKDNHEPATFTVLNFTVDDIEKAVDDLTEKGIKFEQYDVADIKTDEKGISKWEDGPSMAWFVDPARNIIGLMQK